MASLNPNAAMQPAGVHASPQQAGGLRAPASVPLAATAPAWPALPAQAAPHGRDYDVLQALAVSHPPATTPIPEMQAGPQHQPAPALHRLHGPSLHLPTPSMLIHREGMAAGSPFAVPADAPAPEPKTLTQHFARLLEKQPFRSMGYLNEVAQAIVRYVPAFYGPAQVLTYGYIAADTLTHAVGKRQEAREAGVPDANQRAVKEGVKEGSFQLLASGLIPPLLVETAKQGSQRLMKGGGFDPIHFGHHVLGATWPFNMLIKPPEPGHAPGRWFKVPGLLSSSKTFQHIANVVDRRLEWQAPAMFRFFERAEERAMRAGAHHFSHRYEVPMILLAVSLIPVLPKLVDPLLRKLTNKLDGPLDRLLGIDASNTAALLDETRQQLAATHTTKGASKHAAEHQGHKLLGAAPLQPEPDIASALATAAHAPAMRSHPIGDVSLLVDA